MNVQKKTAIKDGRSTSRILYWPFSLHCDILSAQYLISATRCMAAAQLIRACRDRPPGGVNTWRHIRSPVYRQKGSSEITHKLYLGIKKWILSLLLFINLTAVQRDNMDPRGEIRSSCGSASQSLLKKINCKHTGVNMASAFFDYNFNIF